VWRYCGEALVISKSRNETEIVVTAAVMKRRMAISGVMKEKCVVLTAHRREASA